MARKTKRRRHFGSIFRRKGKAGWYVKFAWEANTYRKAVGPDPALGQTKLAAAEALLRAGTSIQEVLSEVFGDFNGTRLTFADARAHQFAIEQLSQGS